MNAPELTLLQAEVAERLVYRVVDALLREDVRGCVSDAQVVRAGAAPFAHIPALTRQVTNWLACRLPGGRLWVPVQESRFMQRWRLHSLPLVWESNGSFTAMDECQAILTCFGRGLPPVSAQLFEDFVGESVVAQEHGILCERERRRAAMAWSEQRPDLARLLDRVDAQTRMLHYDQWAAFHDHPFYPTARAKLGFGGDDLHRYAPEFMPRFALRWVAVPRALYEGTVSPAPWWPSFEAVGLREIGPDTHVLLPVHPFMWSRLSHYLAGSTLEEQIIRAPLACLQVRPTLSVRTLAIDDAPGEHVKLPLPIRTLGARNIRTIKPSTIHDGQAMQRLLAHVAAQERKLADRLLLADEGRGGHVSHQTALGYILRRYPDGLEGAHVLPVAALTAGTPDGRMVMELLADRFFSGAVLTFFAHYLDLTLRLHLLLWVRYGIALESNQQNSVVVLADGAPLRLLLRDNDAGRLWPERALARCPQWVTDIGALQDRRIVVDDELPLAQMFTTITLQLNVAVWVEALAEAGYATRETLYGQVRAKIESVLRELEADGEDVRMARQVLLEEAWMYAKYLLRAATLESKQDTGAADVNKFYGKTAPNFLRLA